MAPTLPSAARVSGKTQREVSTAGRSCGGRLRPGEMYYTSFARYFARPRPGLPYRDLHEYGARLAGVIVKYAGEAPGAATRLGATGHES